MWRGPLLQLPDTPRWAVGILQVGRGWTLSFEPCDQSVSLLSPPRWSQGTQLPVATSEPKLAHLLNERSTGFRDRVYPEGTHQPSHRQGSQGLLGGSRPWISHPLLHPSM